MTEFNDWWDQDDPISASNNFEIGSPAYWAWEGWCAGVKAEREACAKVCEPQEEHDDPLTAWKIAAAIRNRSNT